MTSVAGSATHENQSMERLIDTSNGIIGALMPAIEACSGLFDLERELPKVLDEVRAAVEKVQGLQVEHRQAGSDFADLQSRIAEMKTELITVAEQVSRQKVELESSQSQLQIINKELESLDPARKELTDLQKRMVPLRQEVSQCENDKKEAVKMKVDTERQIRVDRQQHDEEIRQERLKAKEEIEQQQQRAEKDFNARKEQFANENDELQKRLDQDLSQKKKNLTEELRGLQDQADKSLSQKKKQADEEIGQQQQQVDEALSQKRHLLDEELNRLQEKGDRNLAERKQNFDEEMKMLKEQADDAARKQKQQTIYENEELRKQVQAGITTMKQRAEEEASNRLQELQADVDAKIALANKQAKAITDQALAAANKTIQDANNLARESRDEAQKSADRQLDETRIRTTDQERESANGISVKETTSADKIKDEEAKARDKISHDTQHAAKVNAQEKRAIESRESAVQKRERQLAQKQTELERFETTLSATKNEISRDQARWTKLWEDLRTCEHTIRNTALRLGDSITLNDSADLAKRAQESCDSIINTVRTLQELYDGEAELRKRTSYSLEHERKTSTDASKLAADLQKQLLSTTAQMQALNDQGKSLPVMQTQLDEATIKNTALTDRNRVLICRNVMLILRLTQTDNRVMEQHAEALRLQNTATRLQADKRLLATHAEAATKQLKSTGEAHRAEIEEKDWKLGHAERQLKAKTELGTNIAELLKKARADIDGYRVTLNEERESSHTSTQELIKLQQEVQDFRSSLAAREDIVLEERREKRIAEQNAERLAGKLIQADMKVEGLETKLQRTSSALGIASKSANDRNSDHKQELEGKEAAIAELHQQLADGKARDRTVSLRGRLEKVGDELAESKKAITTAQAAAENQWAIHEQELASKEAMISELEHKLDEEKAHNKTQSLQGELQDIREKFQWTSTVLAKNQISLQNQSTDHKTALSQKDAAIMSLQQQLDHEKAGNHTTELSQKLRETVLLLETERANNQTDHLQRRIQELQQTLAAEKVANQTISLRQQVADLTADLQSTAVNDRSSFLQQEVVRLQVDLDIARRQNKELRDNRLKANRPSEVSQRKELIDARASSGDSRPKEARHRGFRLSAERAGAADDEGRSSEPGSKKHTSASKLLLAQPTKITQPRSSDSGESSIESLISQPAHQRRRVGPKSPQKAVTEAYDRLKGSAKRKIAAVSEGRPKKP